MSAQITVPRNWAPRNYQMPLWDYMMGGGTRAVSVWHRRTGKDLTAVNICAVKLCQRVGLYWHLLPTYNQGRKTVWDGMTRDGRKFIDHLPMEMASGVNNTEMKVTFENGSIYQVVGSDNPDRLVGTNPVGVILSEYSLQDPRAWNYIRPILAENKGFALFLYTPRGYNHGHRLYRMAVENPSWHAELLTADDTHVLTPEDIEEERRAGMPEEMIQQEFYCSFSSALMGSYFGTAMTQARAEDRVGDFPYDPLLGTITAWDLGMADQTVVIFAQEHQGSLRIIDCYANSGEGLPHYVNELKRLDYVYDRHHGPHDIRVRDLSTGRSRYEVAQSLGLRLEPVAKLPLEDGIEAIRSLLPRIYWNRTRRTETLIEAVEQYRREWDERSQCFRERPIHDWCSDFVDALRTLAVGMRARRNTQELPTHAQYEYDALAMEFDQ